MSEFFGKPWSQWVADYSESHQHPVNKSCHKIGIPMILASLPCLITGLWSTLIMKIGIALFIAGWVLQFVGHAYEKKPPEFFKDWRFLFVGVRWWLLHARRQEK